MGAKGIPGHRADRHPQLSPGEILYRIRIVQKAERKLERGGNPETSSGSQRKKFTGPDPQLSFFSGGRFLMEEFHIGQG